MEGGREGWEEKGKGGRERMRGRKNIIGRLAAGQNESEGWDEGSEGRREERQKKKTKQMTEVK